MKKFFISRPQYTLVYFDYSAEELRIFAHYLNQPSLTKMLVEDDFHMLTFNTLKPYSKYLQALNEEDGRLWGKRLNFAVAYGAGAAKLCVMLGMSDAELSARKLNGTLTGLPIYEEACNLHGIYCRRFPAIPSLVKKYKCIVERQGYIDTWFGRRRQLTDKAYKGLNSLVQGTGADIMKIAINRVGRLLADTQSHILLTIHDELVVEIYNGEEYLIPQIKEAMEDFPLNVPLEVHINTSKTNWGEVEPLEKEAVL